MDYRGGRFYDADVARFLSLDPAAAEYPSLSDYCYVGGNPVMLVDPDGRAPKVNDPPFSSSSSPVSNVQSSGNSTGSKVKTFMFAIIHPYIATQIGTGDINAVDISGIATRFGKNVGQVGESKTRKHQISNAFRHMNWQGQITQRFGRSIAKDVGFAHEDDRSVYNSDSKIFSNKDDADSKVDVLNNVVGRNLGAKNKDLNPQQLALKILDYQKNNGLWVVNGYESENSSISYKVEKVRLTEKEYLAAKEEIGKLNHNAFTKEQQAKYDNRGKGANSKVTFKPLR